MKTEVAITECVKRLKTMMGQKPEVAGVAPAVTNQDQTGEHGYEGEGLTDPGYNHNGVTGTGAGRELGHHRTGA